MYYFKHERKAYVLQFDYAEYVYSINRKSRYERRGHNLSRTDEDPRENRQTAMKERIRFRSEDAGTLGS